MPVLPQSFLHLRRTVLYPAINSAVIDIHASFSQQLWIADAVFTEPAYCPEDGVPLKCRPSGWLWSALLAKMAENITIATIFVAGPDLKSAESRAT